MPQDRTKNGLVPSASAGKPSPARGGFAIVGMGASAGGLAAFSAFFAALPADQDPGIAFVLVQHLAPDHDSMLTELLQRDTSMQVIEVTDGIAVQINSIYIIPPNHDMALINGTLALLAPTEAHGHRLPIHYFFESLAQDQREHAIAIVLSGTGSDGTLGLRAIKASGGMVMAQTPESSAFDGMPLSAMATGLVDYSLAPADMAVQLMRYVRHAFVHPRSPSATSAHDENSLKKIFALLRTQTGHDFSQYKPNTICRRIERRMAVQQVAALDDYIKFLQQTPAEVEALFRDVLIGVTSFFRDPDSFTVLAQQVIAKIVHAKAPGSTIRVWSAGCSTGEEAYSIAILLHEQIEQSKQSYTVQLFATDIDKHAISQARTGIFPASIASDISPERLARFFSPERDGACYRVNKVIRDMLIFSEHNLIKSPPFSKIDLISCRNVLIYLGVELQKKLIALFHYALNPGGNLFLGSSETVGDHSELFSVLDRKAKLYQRNADSPAAGRAALMRFLPAQASDSPQKKEGVVPTKRSLKQSLRELTERTLLTQITPVAALVNGHGDVQYFHGRTGMYLEPTPGDAGTNNILKMARSGLQATLTTHLHKAVATKARVFASNVNVKTNGHFSAVDLTICPISPEAASTEVDASLSLYLVILTASPSPPEPTAPIALGIGKSRGFSEEANTLISKLLEQLSAKDAFLHVTNEALESANEELKSSNEEMQSINEELQSTNEELETSKEELQSINEELSTVNTELQSKVSDLSRANNDMNNLLAGTGIGTIFVDHALRILRFTPAATSLINLIPADIGRPVGHIVSNLVGYDCLVADLQSVLKTLVPKHIEVKTRAMADSEAVGPNEQGKAGTQHHFALRILPYRTLENVIEGAVITFVDVTEVVRTREALRAANEQLRLAVVVRDAHDAILVQDLTGQITAWNPGATRLYGWSEAEALSMNARDLIPPPLRDAALERMHQLSQAQVLEPCLTQRISKDGRTLDISLISTALVNASGGIYAIATTERLLEAQAT